MKLLVDTSVWSLAFRRDTPSESPEVAFLSRSLDSDAEVYSTGLILQELLQGFSGLKAAEAIIERFTALPMVIPDTQDHIEAAQVRNLCRRKGVQVGTVNALIAQLALRHDLELLTTDSDCKNMSKHVRLKLAMK